ncbi:retrovirus-related pol polyprotein from transposon TNT 1-94 [Tanacetum coccineum]
MDTKEISDRYVAPCFVNGLEAYDSVINLGMKKNMISNEFAVKLCLGPEVKCGNKVVKKELIVALRGEIYFVKFIIHPEEDNVEPGFWRRRKIGDEWDLLLDDLEFGDILDIKGVKVPPFVCKMGKNKMKKEEVEVMIKIKGDALIEKEDPGAFVIPIWLEGKINLNALADTGSDINVMPYRVYKKLGREEVQNVKKGITMLNHSKAKPMGLLKDVLCQVGVTTIIIKFLILNMPVDRDTSILVGRRFLYTCGSILNIIERITSTFDGICHQTFCATKTSLDTAESDSDEEEEYVIQRNKFRAPIYGLKLARYLNCSDPLDRSLALREETIARRRKVMGSGTPRSD